MQRLLGLLLRSRSIHIQERRNIFCCLLAWKLDAVELDDRPFFVNHHNSVGICSRWWDKHGCVLIGVIACVAVVTGVPLQVTYQRLLLGVDRDSDWAGIINWTDRTFVGKTLTISVFNRNVGISIWFATHQCTFIKNCPFSSKWSFNFFLLATFRCFVSSNNILSAHLGIIL